MAFENELTFGKVLHHHAETVTSSLGVGDPNIIEGFKRGYRRNLERRLDVGQTTILTSTDGKEVIIERRRQGFIIEPK
ncbi:MAG: hypothetical protein Q7S88_03275 [Candidatus Daviesbacteria bacterium]|nr:hypothetical protein [Candidatus Daviesbacteria bacterium]